MKHTELTEETFEYSPDKEAPMFPLDGDYGQPIDVKLAFDISVAYHTHQCTYTQYPIRDNYVHSLLDFIQRGFFAFVSKINFKNFIKIFGISEIPVLRDYERGNTTTRLRGRERG